MKNPLNVLAEALARDPAAMLPSTWCAPLRQGVRTTASDVTEAVEMTLLDLDPEADCADAPDDALRGEVRLESFDDALAAVNSLEAALRSWRRAEADLARRVERAKAKLAKAG
jgi:hypothetical protein